MRVPRQNRIGLAAALCAAAVGAAALIAPFAGASDDGVPEPTGTERPGEEFHIEHVDDLADSGCFSATQTGDDAPEVVTGDDCEFPEAPEDAVICGDGAEEGTEVVGSVTVEASADGVVCEVEGEDITS
ncbi:MULTISPECIES: hypothetical protein [Actinoalloteichus]|uniref:Secreted protein n=1 Tax=Actinoalloteichus caeruleus DSM 43889 TaxID=1120930 RepID=A0ABT1JLY2_ACTCY|nr:hypothetical protein [Actinoalloteichus caeruleus]MCP2333534.1 hypothetical protein [Actinoalloteichus caeruleus DSM 43889]